MGYPVLAALALTAPLAAKDSLGVFSGWGVFRSASVPTCYAITEAEPKASAGAFQPYATVASWPARRVENQVHFRLSRKRRADTSVILRIGRRNFPMVAGDADAWAKDGATNSAILAAIRAANTMQIYATDTRGRRFSDSYALSGAATAIDAATLACSRRR